MNISDEMTEESPSVTKNFAHNLNKLINYTSSFSKLKKSGIRKKKQFLTSIPYT